MTNYLEWLLKEVVVGSLRQAQLFRRLPEETEGNHK
jgi:hypothetical protein